MQPGRQASVPEIRPPVLARVTTADYHEGESDARCELRQTNGTMQDLDRAVVKLPEPLKMSSGPTRALDYLIGEKFLNFLQAAEDHAEWQAEIPAFVAEIKRIFERWQLAEYLEKARQTPAIRSQASTRMTTILRRWRWIERRTSAFPLVICCW